MLEDIPTGDIGGRFSVPPPSNNAAPSPFPDNDNNTGGEKRERDWNTPSGGTPDVYRRLNYSDDEAEDDQETEALLAMIADMTSEEAKAYMARQVPVLSGYTLAMVTV